MPTANDYRAAARRYRATADRLTQEAAVLHRWALGAGIGEGAVLDAVLVSIAATRRLLGATGRELDGLAAVCDRRARVCDDYAAARRAHAELDPLGRLLTSAPVPAAAWVEA